MYLDDFRSPLAAMDPSLRYMIEFSPPELSLVFRRPKDAAYDCHTLAIKFKKAADFESVFGEMRTLGLNTQDVSTPSQRPGIPSEQAPLGLLMVPGQSPLPVYSPYGNSQQLYNGSPPVLVPAYPPHLSIPGRPSSQPFGQPVSRQQTWSSISPPLQPPPRPATCPGVPGEGIYRVKRVSSSSSGRPRARHLLAQQLPTIPESRRHTTYTVSKHFDRTLGPTEITRISRRRFSDDDDDDDDEVITSTQQMERVSTENETESYGPSRPLLDESSRTKHLSIVSLEDPVETSQVLNRVPSTTESRIQDSQNPTTRYKLRRGSTNSSALNSRHATSPTLKSKQGPVAQYFTSSQPTTGQEVYDMQRGGPTRRSSLQDNETPLLSSSQPTSSDEFSGMLRPRLTRHASIQDKDTPPPSSSQPTTSHDFGNMLRGGLKRHASSHDKEAPKKLARCSKDILGIQLSNTAPRVVQGTNRAEDDDSLFRILEINQKAFAEATRIWAELMEKGRKETESIEDRDEAGRIWSKYGEEWARRMESLTALAVQRMKEARGRRIGV
ncbi:hypothetical protein B0T17DRAFT_505711 [Bombardia bombarda]|uniref:Uncharacterized protein n=1 Tax=Bombardia bombarda TaxID=252184 RepID=A0AA39X872_9PEZI|nr:hypothetical protein B0T17DRAFT_505711 [Bombardia bombarda]